jgi:transcriptional regulator with XRE-family HTH domain
MTGAEFKAAREAWGFTQPQMAALMGYGSSPRISELEARDVVKGPPARLMEAYLAGYRPGDWPG